MNIHQKYIKRCLHLAKNGLGTTYPNPLVGSVVVHNNKIVGEGWHQKAGMTHAEVNAINSVTDKSLLKVATIYVNLEPCFHFGKTPPCCDLIIDKNIPKIVIANQDPFDKVAGKSIQKLRERGHNVQVGVLENDAWLLNKRFFTFHQQKRPWVILKWAQTHDNFIAPLTQNNQAPFWISNKYSRQKVHQMRSQEMAVLVGTNTVVKDNPSLTTREWNGSNPTRVVIDLNNKLKENYSVFDEASTTIVLSYKDIKIYPEHVKVCVIEKSKNFWEQVMAYLYHFQIQSLIVEGGALTLQSLINQDLWDEARIFESNNRLVNGVKAPEIKGHIASQEFIGNDKLITMYHDNYQKYHI